MTFHRLATFAVVAALSLASRREAAAQGATGDKTSEVAAVRAAIEKYVQAHATGDGNHLKDVFHPELKLFFVRNGQVTTRPGPEYIAGFSGKPAADEPQRKRRIEGIEVTGSAAVAKVILDYPATTFTDYFQLVKANDGWKIVSKTFHAQPKTP